MKKSRRLTLHFVISLVSHSNYKNIVTHICAGCRACIHLLHRRSHSQVQPHYDQATSTNTRPRMGWCEAHMLPGGQRCDWLTDWLKCFITITRGQNHIQSTPKHLRSVDQACESSLSISECHHNNSTETIFLWVATVRQWCSSQLPWHWFKLQCHWSI